MLNEHLSYVADRIRLDQYRAAIAKVVRPRDIVADIGCGSGILGLLCLQAGAGRVFAIDSTAMIEVAQETLTRAHLGDRGVFIRDDSRRVVLPEPVDVVICDHVGYFGFDYNVVHTLQDARQRFLKPEGAVIPARIRLQVCAIESDKCREKVEGWRVDHVPSEFHWLRHHAVNAEHSVELARNELLCVPADLGEIDLREDNPDFFSWTVELRMARDGMFHGLAGWFECELAKDVWMTNSPLSDRAIHRPQAFLPIEEAVPVKSGDLVRATVMARPSDNLIAWIVDQLGSGRRVSHSTWQGMLSVSEDLIRANPTRVPRLSRKGRNRLTVLGYCDGRRTVQEIREAVLREHPDLFPSSGEISSFVAQVLGGDTE